LKAAGAGTAASLACLAGHLAPGPAAARAAAPARSERAITLGLASYTLRKFDLDQTLAMTQRVGLGVICLKSMHLPLEATPEEIDAAVTKVKDAGIVLYGGGVIGMKNDEQVDQAFE